MKKIIIPICLCLVFFYTCSDDDSGSNNVEETPEIVDARDGQSYEIVTIGTQTWMAQNLNFDPADDNRSCYDNSDINCIQYGSLYHADALATICPEGYRLPTVSDWETLINYFGGFEIAARYLSDGAVSNGELVGFNMKTAGYYNGFSYTELGEAGYYWTATAGSFPGSLRYVKLIGNQIIDASGSLFAGGNELSCRCIKN